MAPPIRPDRKSSTRPARVGGRGLLTLLFVLFFNAMAAAQVSPACGDCNGDGTLDVLDALQAAQIGVGVHQPTPLEQWRCNVDGDQTVGVLDALLLVQLGAEGLPGSTDVHYIDAYDARTTTYGIYPQYFPSA